MAELAIRFVRKMTHANWLPGRAISFSYRPAGFGGKFPSRFEDKRTRFMYVLKKIYNNKLRKKKLNVLDDNF